MYGKDRGLPYEAMQRTDNREREGWSLRRRPGQGRVGREHPRARGWQRARYIRWPIGWCAITAAGSNDVGLLKRVSSSGTKPALRESSAPCTKSVHPSIRATDACSRYSLSSPPGMTSATMSSVSVGMMKSNSITTTRTSARCAWSFAARTCRHHV